MDEAVTRDPNGLATAAVTATAACRVMGDDDMSWPSVR